MSTARSQRRRITGDTVSTDNGRRTIDRRTRDTAVATPRVRDVQRCGDVELRFVVTGELGRGGMGRVVAAIDTLLERDVAIKQALDDVDGLRFEREARITARLEHPSIVPIHDAGRDEHGRPYYVMRRIAGDPLARRIASARDLATRLALVPRFAIAVDAAGFAHARGVIHRDIKPANILLGAHGETLLIDWGLARHVDETDETDGSGTPGYIAPEQARGDRVDARADVYALGVTLFEILTGKLPGTDAVDPGIPAELVAIASKALAGKQDDRYRDAGELATDLHAFLDGRVVAAHRYSASARVGRFVRRHRVVVAIASAAAIAVAAIGVVAVARVVDERDLARAAKLDAEAGQRLAADRAEVLILDRASGLAERDPTHAVALLATLPAGSAHTARARDIASIAALHGIEHGAVAHDGGIVALEIAPDGHHVLSAGGYDGTIQIRDLATGTARTIVHGPIVERAVWTDRGHTISFIAHDAGLRVVDVDSGTVRTLEPHATADTMWAVGDGDRVRLHDDNQHAVIEISTRTGASRVVARDVATVALSGDRVVVAGTGAVRVIDAGGDRVVARYTGADPGTLAVSDDGQRIAARFLDATTEWQVATGARRGSWPGVVNPIYAGARLYGADLHRNGRLELLTSTATYEALAADWSVMWSTRAGSRIAVVDAAGDLGLLGEDGFRELRFDHQGSRMIAGRTDSPYLVVGAGDGSIRWWDLRAFVPESHALPSGNLCDLDAERIYVRQLGHLALVSRHGGAIQAFDVKGLACGSHAGTRVVVTGPPGTAPTFDVIDTKTGRARHLAGEPIIDRDAIYVTRGRTIYEVGDGDGEPIARWTAPVDMLGVVASAGAFGIQLADRRLVHVDAATGTTTSFRPAAAPSVFQLGAGTWFYAAGTRVYRRDGDVEQIIGELASPVQTLWLTSTGACIVLTDERSLWRATPHGFERLDSIPLGQPFAIAGRTLATLRHGGARFTYLDSGEAMSVPVRDATSVRVLDDDRVFAIVRNTDTVRVDLYTDSVPRDPAQLGSWLHTATNAVVEPGSMALTWR